MKQTLIEATLVPMTSGVAHSSSGQHEQPEAAVGFPGTVSLSLGTIVGDVDHGDPSEADDEVFHIQADGLYGDKYGFHDSEHAWRRNSTGGHK